MKQNEDRFDQTYRAWEKNVFGQGPASATIAG